MARSRPVATDHHRRASQITRRILTQGASPKVYRDRDGKSGATIKVVRFSRNGLTDIDLIRQCGSRCQAARLERIAQALHYDDTGSPALMWRR
jgi:hypothetical protein